MGVALAGNTTDYLGKNKDWLQFVENMSQNSGDAHGDKWIANARENKQLVRQCGWITEEQDSHEGKTAVLCGASQAIRNQFGQLSELRNDKDFVFMGITSGFKMLVENGITPDYCMMMDADMRQERFWEGLDMSKTKDTTLIASICAPNALLKRWQGPIKFLALMADYKDAEKKFVKWFHPVNGCGIFFHALFSQYNTAAAVAYLIFGMRIIIFVGSEFSFPKEDTPYYADRKDEKDSWQRGIQPDIYGNPVYTNYMLFSCKLALEDYLGKLPGFYMNCTEAGIFGVSARHKNTPWILNMKLGMGISQARHIMRTGKPIYI